MSSNRENIGQMFGSAAIGVAVGMLIQKALSPSCSQNQETSEASVIRYEYMQARPQANKLHISSHCMNHKKNRHHSHSKSVSSSKRRREKIEDLSVPTNSPQKLQLSASETDLQTKLETHSNEISTRYLPLKSIEPENSIDRVENNYNPYITLASTLTAFTENLPIKLKDEDNLSATFKDLDSYREYLGNKSTDYLPIKIANNSANSQSLLFDIGINNKSITNNNDETFNYSIIATCDTFEKDLNLD